MLTLQLIGAMLVRLLAVSTALLFTSVLASTAHEIRPAVSDITLSESSAEIQITLTAETLMAGIDATAVADTNDAPEAARYDELRALEPGELATQFQAAWPEISSGFILMAGETAVLLELAGIEVADMPDFELPRDTRLSLSATLPEDGSDIRFGWTARNGPLIVRQAGGGDDAYAGFLENGAMSEALPREGFVSETAGAVFWRYIFVGFDHIVPKGLDHILFVLGLFFLSLKMGPLITQVTVFTVAHTITLALASLGIVTVSPAIVEPLIAASIVYVAVENIFAKGITPWRPVIIFLFGLLHGLGFASVLGEFGLAPGRFVAGLIGFNVGVEVGQLFVIAMAFILIWLTTRAANMKALTDDETPARSFAVAYRAIALCGSIVIAIIGAYWAVERVIG